MSTVTSAYNFVPINENVCLPAWADAVSQDVPLQGAVSGVIDLTITAKTPIFVRGKSTVPDQNVHQEYEFMKHDDRFCIPGSSIKGTIASVLEILTFGKLQKVNDHRFEKDKIKCRYSVKELIPREHSIVKKDFVETLFGYSEEKESIKGRVSFKHAYANGDEVTGAAKTLILGGPKASYYPFYLKQEFLENSDNEISTDYQTYNNESTLAGRKRYPIKNIYNKGKVDKSKISTTFTPINTETVFTTKIVYHNLLPVELGALLCALTFNGVEDCHHGIGMAKPYGYGAVQIDVLMDTAIRNQAMLAFRKYMELWWIHNGFDGTWSKSEQLQELIAMARFSTQTKKLSYMDLATFARIKTEKKALPRFTNFLGIQPLEYPEEKRIRLEKAEAKAAKEKQEKIDRILVKGLTSWLSEITSYGILKAKMNEWLVMQNDEFITDKVELEYLKNIIIQLRNRKAPKHREGYFDENKKNDLNQWMGSDETDNFLQNL